MLTDRIPEKYRQPVRFTIVGSTGTLIQYGIYWLMLYVFGLLWPETALTQVAFTIGFLVEMCTNYCLTTWYTFSSSPSWKNASGFLLGRAVNYVIQLACLQSLLWLHMPEKPAGFLAIVIAGIINFFVVRIFFKEKTDNIPQA